VKYIEKYGWNFGRQADGSAGVQICDRTILSQKVIARNIRGKLRMIVVAASCYGWLYAKK